MRALRLYGPKDMRIDDIPLPVINDEELLIKICYCSICGSDFRNTASGGSSHGMDLPIVTGHEIVGEIVQVGERWKKEFEIGEKVVVGAVVPCGRCSFCINGCSNQCSNKKTISYQIDGGFAEYMKIPKESIASGNVIKFRNDKDSMKLALCEPLSCAINGQEISKVSLGDTVIVAGCGPLGMFHIQLARLNGASLIIALDINQERLNLAKQLGADCILNPKKVDVDSEIKNYTKGFGVDVVITAVPSVEIVKSAFQWISNRGRINIFGGLPKNHSELSIDLNLIHYKEISVQGTSDSTAEHLNTAMKLIVSNRIKTDRIISKIVGLQEARDILLEGPKSSYIKIVVNPHQMY